MKDRETIFKKSVLEFKGELPDYVKGVFMKFSGDYELKYFICSSSLNEDLNYTVECILHEILTNLGIIRDRKGEVTGYKFKIDYEIVSVDEICRLSKELGYFNIPIN
jgi:hypothetical protein